MRFEKPVGMVELSCEPLGDGRVRLHVIPSVEHGEMPQQWGTAGGLDGVFQPSSSGVRVTRLPHHPSPGQTLLVTAGEAKGLGAEFFARGGGHGRSVMLVRLAQTQMDDLFNPTPVRRPLATTTDSAVW